MYQAMISEIAKNKLENFKPSFDEINKKMSPNELLKNSEKLGISGDKFEIEGIKNEVAEKEKIAEKSNYSNEVNEKIRSVEELEVYQNEGLVESTVNDRTVLKDTSINPDLIDEKGRTNLERMEKGLAPIDENGKPYNLHHIGQNADSPLAELKDGVHKKNDAILHDKSKPTEVHGENSSVNWDKERSEHWKARAEEIKAQQNKGV
ncbi:MAG: HNH/ENDO VII family nuclease [Aliarcobacter sp.]|jgi:hypothetical protein|nr:HNH/ENDO VII family nuclease [Aliarcobacter sp.]